MKAPGPRPAPVRLFAVLFVLQALFTFYDGMRDPARTMRYLAGLVPELHAGHDLAIVMMSARLSIALIPIALIWFLRADFARWFLVVATVARLAGLPQAVALVEAGRGLSPWWLASMVLAFGAVALLFTPSARSWFRRRKAPDAAVFR